MIDLSYSRRIRSLLDTSDDRTSGVCFGCGQRLTDLYDAVLIFVCPSEHYDRSAPRMPRIGHSPCGPGQYTGDTVDIAQLVIEGPAASLAFYATYPWWEPEFAEWIHSAYVVGTSLPVVPASPMRLVSESIPRRAPRTPPNPRAISVTLRARVLERDDFRCRRCGCGPGDSPLVVDHITPVAKGGTARLDNLQTLCRPCNAGKSDRAPHPHDFAGAARG